MAGSAAMSMCSTCGCARMAHRNGHCTICGRACGTGYQTVVNVASPNRPKAVGGPSHPTRTSQESGRRSVRPAARWEPRTPSPKKQLVAFVNANLNEAQLIVLTRRLEKRHRYQSQHSSIKQRFGDLVYLKIDHTTAQSYLDEFHRRQRDGKPLIQG